MLVDPRTPPFIDKSVFSENFIPPSLPGREEQVALFTEALSPLFNDRTPEDVMFIGKHGTGKTSLVKNVIIKYKEVYPRTKFIYMSCTITNTFYRVLYALDRALWALIPPSGLPSSFLMDQFVRAYKSWNSRLVVVLDDIEALKERDNVIRSLSELGKEGPGMSFVVITNNELELKGLDPFKIHFPPYTQSQLYNILKQRAELGLRMGTWDDEALQIIASKVARESGDAGVAIEALRKAVGLMNGAERLTVEHAKRALSLIEEERVISSLRILPPHYKLIVAAIADVLEKPNLRPGTGAIYGEYVKKAMKYGLKPLTKRRVSGILRELESLGIVKLRLEYGGARGITKVVTDTALPTWKMKEILQA
ncbi:MAG: AAA family ATPase [Candidatus Bathyarchaeia archaeon]